IVLIERLPSSFVAPDAPRGGSPALDMGLEEPEVLVEGPRDLGEEIRGRGVPGLRGLSDRATHRGGELGDLMDEGANVALAFHGRQVVLADRGGLGRLPRRALCNAPQGDHALGQEVAVLLHTLRDLVEELVEGDELGALDVPVREFRLVEEVARARQPLVQERDKGGANVGTDVDARGIGSGFAAHAFTALKTPSYAFAVTETSRHSGLLPYLGRGP